MDEILTFSGTGKLNLAAALKQTQLKRPQAKPKSKKWGSSTNSDSSSSCGEDDHPISRRRRRKRRHAERRGVAARLKQHATALEEISSTLDDTASPGSKEEEEEEEEGWGVDDSIYHVLCSGFYFHVSPFPSLSCHIVHNPPPPPSLSFVLSCVRSRTERSSKAVKELSPPASPIPSPPPLFFFSPPEGKQSNTLRKADQLLQELKQPQAYSSPLSMSLLDYSSSILEISGTPSTAAASDSKLTLRVRCRGKIHRFTVNKADPLVLICTDLGKELGVKGEQILLSHRMSTLDPASSPATLSLSTADILDAIVLEEDQLRTRLHNTSTASLDLAESITIKVQTSKKNVVYSLAKTDTLAKVMTAFAAALEVPVRRLQFTFDGDPVLPDQTPSDLDMDHDDIIDARLLS